MNQNLNHSASHWTSSAREEMRAKELASLSDAMDVAIAAKDWDRCIELSKTMQRKLVFQAAHASVTNERCSPSNADYEALDEERMREGWR